MCVFSRREILLLTSHSFEQIWNLEFCIFTWYTISMRAGKHRLIKMLFILLLSINLVLPLMKNHLKKFYLCQSPLQRKYQSWGVENLIKKHKISNKDVPCFCGLSLPWWRFFWEDKLLEQWISERTALFSCVGEKVSLNFGISSE